MEDETLDIEEVADIGEYPLEPEYEDIEEDLGGEDIAVQIEMMLDDTTFQSGYRPPVVLTDAINGDGIDELLQYIWDHKEHLELSDILSEKKKNRFNYKITELIHSKVEKILKKSFFNQGKIKELVEHAMDDGKFKIYEIIHNKFEVMNLEIKEDN